MLPNTNGQATNQVNDQNQQTSDRVTTDKFGSTVHGTEKVGLLRQLFAAFFGHFLVDHTRIQIGIDRHLFAGHRIQCESCIHFRNAPRPLGHHNEVDDHQDSKDDEADNVVAADDELTKGGDHFTGCFVTFMAVDQNHAGGSHVQTQPQHRRKQQHRRKR